MTNLQVERKWNNGNYKNKEFFRIFHKVLPYYSYIWTMGSDAS
jgi:hypothetical protein